MHTHPVFQKKINLTNGSLYVHTIVPSGFQQARTPAPYAVCGILITPKEA
jgi:hypothetical protein